eukprot:ctg_880.g372
MVTSLAAPSPCLPHQRQPFARIVVHAAHGRPTIAALIQRHQHQQHQRTQSVGDVVGPHAERHVHAAHIHAVQHVGEQRGQHPQQRQTAAMAVRKGGHNLRYPHHRAEKGGGVAAAVGEQLRYMAAGGGGRGAGVRLRAVPSIHIDGGDRQRHAHGDVDAKEEGGVSRVVEVGRAALIVMQRRVTAGAALGVSIAPRPRPLRRWHSLKRAAFGIRSSGRHLSRFLRRHHHLLLLFQGIREEDASAVALATPLLIQPLIPQIPVPQSGEQRPGARRLHRGLKVDEARVGDVSTGVQRLAVVTDQHIQHRQIGVHAAVKERP